MPPKGLCGCGPYTVDLFTCKKCPKLPKACMYCAMTHVSRLHTKLKSTICRCGMRVNKNAFCKCFFKIVEKIKKSNPEMKHKIDGVTIIFYDEYDTYYQIRRNQRNMSEVYRKDLM